EHAVAVVVWEYQQVRRGDAGEAGQAALERAVRPPLGVGGGEEEERRLLDEGLVGVVEAVAPQRLVQAVGQGAAASQILQLALALVIHGGPLQVSGGGGRAWRRPRPAVAGGRTPPPRTARSPAPRPLRAGGTRPQRRCRPARRWRPGRRRHPRSRSP